MQERQDSDWEKVLERSKMPPRQVDYRPVMAAIIVCSAGGFFGATWAIDHVKETSEFVSQALNPPTSFALQFSAAGILAFLGAGIGFSLEKYIAEGEI